MHGHLRGDSSREARVDCAVSLPGTPAPALRPSALRAPGLTACPPAREGPASGPGAPAVSLERLLFFSEPRFLEVHSPLLHRFNDGLQARPRSVTSHATRGGTSPQPHMKSRVLRDGQDGSSASTPADSRSLTLAVTTRPPCASTTAAFHKSPPLRPNPAVQATECNRNGRPGASQCARHAGTGQCSQATGNATIAVPELARKTPSACPP